MINRQKRGVAGQLIRKFLDGTISNDDFDNNYPSPDNDDRAIGAIHERLWGFWDDRQEHRLTGKYELDPEARALFERCIAFLNSDLEYEWPPLKWRNLSQAFLRLIGLRRIAERRGDEWTQQVKKIGKWEAWPFIREEDLVRGSVRSQKVS